MRQILSGSRGLTLICRLNTDLMLYGATLIGSLLLGSFVASL